MLEPAELLLPHPAAVLEQFPPIFIVGAPRSGSTLLMQALVRALDVSYLSNRHARFPGAPALVERFARPRIASAAPFTSSLGATNGPSGPSECAAWWYRFFPRSPVYVPSGQLPAHDGTRLVRSLAALTAAAGRPVLFKNLYASLRIRAILEVVPSARFIQLERDITDNALSLLAARRTKHSDERTWFSLPPPGWEEASTWGAAAQVVWQVRTTNDIVGRDLAESGVPAAQWLHLNYEDFCADPRGHVAGVREAFGLTERAPGSIAAIPEAFPRAERGAVPADLRTAVERRSGAAPSPRTAAEGGSA